MIFSFLLQVVYSVFALGLGIAVNYTFDLIFCVSERTEHLHHKTVAKRHLLFHQSLEEQVVQVQRVVTCFISYSSRIMIFQIILICTCLWSRAAVFDDKKRLGEVADQMPKIAEFL